MIREVGVEDVVLLFTQIWIDRCGAYSIVDIAFFRG